MTVGEGEHPLQCPYAFWFSRRAPGKLQSSTNYADNIKLVGKFASVSCSLCTKVTEMYSRQLVEFVEEYD